MRRADRQVSDLIELEKMIRSCDVCRLGLCYDNIPYVVPMNFGYELQGEKLTLYFHCANEGKKLDILRKNPNACFEMDCGHELVAGKTGCDWSMNFESIIGQGKIEFVEEMQEKTAAVSKLMEHYSGRTDFSFDENLMNHVTVLKLISADFTGKRRK